MSSKAKKSRPASTAAISLPQVHDSSAFTAISRFSPNTDLFALLSLAVDKHRLRVFDAITGNALVEYTVDDARVTSLTWALIIVLGLSNGSLLLFSPTHSRVVRTLSHPSSLAPVLATSAGSQADHMWSSGEDGVIRLWNASRNELLGSWKNESGPPYSALAPRPNRSFGNETELLVAHHAVRMLSLPVSTPSVSEPVKPDQQFSFTGHVSAVSYLQWDVSHPSRFISVAESDRFVQVWRVPDTSVKEGTILASAPLDASAKHAALSPTDSTNLLAVSASGKVTLFDLPSPTKSATKVATLSPRSTISTPGKKSDNDVQVVAAAFIPQELGSVRIARLQSGIRPVFEVVRYLDHSGDFIPKVLLSKDISAILATTESSGLSTSQKRYTEAPTLAVGSGVELGQDTAMDDIQIARVDGDLDVDLAELSLGQRLAVLSGGTGINEKGGSSSDEADSPSKPRRRRKKMRGTKGMESDRLPVPANSLSRTLVQALHSGDTGLLETCLTHTDEKLVLNTVRRLPPQLAVTLLDACVERLGRGARAGTGKGGGGGASAQRGTGLIKWVRAVLIVHTGHLITIPDIVARLSGLHATLTARLALRDPLLSLSGRLDFVLSQIEMRSSVRPTSVIAEGKTAGQESDQRTPLKYVEGESESEEEGENDEVEMEVERDQDGGSIEDVELGRESGSDAEEGESSEEDEEENSEGDEGLRVNGFIDYEAEELSDDEDEDYSEE